MSPAPRVSGGHAAPLLHWLVLVSGLALLTTGRIIENDAIVPTCVGAILGTGIGQSFAALRMRAWTAFLATGVVILIGAMILSGATHSSGTVLEAFVPAAACGYLSLTSRGALAAFWFPAVPWTLAILDAESSEGAAALPGWSLWTALGAFLVVALWTRETRRVVQWKSHALGDLAEPPTRVVLHASPLGTESRALWSLALGGMTIVLAAWIAPLLRQWEPGDGKAQGATATNHESADHPASVTANGSPGTWLTCCPEAPAPTVPTKRVKEYFTPKHEEALDAPRPAPRGCVACSGGVPVQQLRDARAAAASTDYDGSMNSPVEGGATDAYAPNGAAGASPQAAARATDIVPPDAAPPTGSPPPAVAARLAPPAPIAANPPAHATAPYHGRTSLPAAAPADAAAELDDEGGHPILRSFLALVLAASAVSLVLRPVRRWVILRHLRKPWWQETVSQRVSNLWQLTLVGLRDAGWHIGSSELPQELARRVGVAGMKTCADVLDRARHGVRVDADDVAAMERAAGEAFAAARARAGGVARVASWWRSPVG